MPLYEQVASILSRLRESHTPQDSNALYATSYRALRELASRALRGELARYSLHTTALVNEAYLRLEPQSNAGTTWNSPAHFFGAADRAMKQVLIERARRRQTQRHHGEHRSAPLLSEPLDPTTLSSDYSELHEAWNRFHQLYPRKALVVLFRHFFEFTIEETGSILQCSTNTVERDDVFAKKWLANFLRSDLDEDHDHRTRPPG